MRYKALAAILFLFLSTALTASANSVQGKSKSNYGDTPYLTDVGSSETSGGAFLQLVCPVSVGCPATGESDLLEVTFPAFGFTPGALFDINGIDTSQEVDIVCDYSLIGACDGSVLSVAQQNCVNTIGGSIVSASTYQVAIPNCSGFIGTEMTLIFGLSSDFSSIPASMSVTPAGVTAPEPASWMLLAAGVVVLMFKRRANAGASLAS